MDLTNEELLEIVKKYDESFNPLEPDEMEVQLAEEERLTQNLSEFLGSNESELTLNVKKLATNSKFIFSTLYLAADCSDDLHLSRFIIVLDILGETLHIKITKETLKKLADILGAFEEDKISINYFFKQLRIHIRKLYPELLAPIIKDNIDNVELHENLLLNSQNFRNFIDEDDEKELAHTSFTIRSIYSRAKSGRPITGKVMNQEMDEYRNNLDDIPEVNNEMIGEKDEHDLLDKKSTSQFKLSKNSVEIVEQSQNNQNNQNILPQDEPVKDSIKEAEVNKESSSPEENNHVDELNKENKNANNSNKENIKVENVQNADSNKIVDHNESQNIVMEMNSNNFNFSGNNYSSALKQNESEQFLIRGDSELKNGSNLEVPKDSNEINDNKINQIAEKVPEDSVIITY